MRCLALFTGGLDSQIAVCLLQRQGIEVIGLHVQTPFTGPAAGAAQAAERLGIELRRIDWRDDYLQLLTQPRLGFAEGMAPCLDCRAGMVRRAGELLEPLGASFLISGEVVGQRPSSLRSRDLETIAYHGKADDLLLRPLSALLLPPTLPERNGWVDRSQLLGWHGRGRREQLQLAREWGLTEPDDHSPGCVLLEPTYASRLRRVVSHDPRPPAWRLATLRMGRHFWRKEGAQLVLSKNATEGDDLRRLFQSVAPMGDPAAMLLEPMEFRGPVGLLMGDVAPAACLAAADVVQRYSKEIVARRSHIRMHRPGHDISEMPLPRATDTPGDLLPFEP
jgi:tRNA-specific 2-thiouridylase